MDKQKAKNLYRTLITDQKSIFYAMYAVTKGLVKLDNNSKKRNTINEKPPLNTAFFEKQEDVDRPTLYSFSGPFEVLHADIADIRFLGKSAADLKYCLLFLDLFTSVIYTYPMKKRSLLYKKMLIFYKGRTKKRMDKMLLQTDHEF